MASPGSAQTIAGLLTLQAAARGAHVVLRHEGGAIDYAGLDDQVRRFAAFLASRGIASGARVALLLPNLPELAVAYFGALAAGCIAVPVNARLAPPEVENILTSCGAAALITTHAQVARLAGRARRSDVLRVLVGAEAAGSGADGVPFAGALRVPPRPAPAPAEPQAVATLLYTSGTTGRPKGALISHANALFNAASARATLGYAEDDVGLVALPLFHVTALHSQLVALVACGASLVLQREYDTGQLLELVSRHRVTALFLVPAVYRLLALRQDLDRLALRSVRVAAYGGAPMAPETVRALQRILPAARLHNCYGLTESSSLATVLPSELALARADSVGRPVPGTQAEVRGDDGAPLPPGEIGELFLRGPHVVSGYWNAPEETAAAIRSGWLRTGDLARIDKDGLVAILDRKKDMINRGGEKVYGLEVENRLLAFPGIAEAAVVGIPHPIFGEVPAAFLVPVPGSTPDLDALRIHCAAGLADFKVPVAFKLVAALPRNAGGKVLKGELRGAWDAPRGAPVDEGGQGPRGRSRGNP